MGYGRGKWWGAAICRHGAAPPAAAASAAATAESAAAESYYGNTTTAITKRLPAGASLVVDYEVLINDSTLLIDVIFLAVVT